MHLKMRVDAAEKVRRMIDDLMDQGPYIPSLLAHDLVTKLREEDPELLAQWLDKQAEAVMRDTVNTINRARRAHARANASRSVFHNAVERAKAGQPQLLEGFLEQEFSVNEDHTRKKLRDMYKEEVLYASQVFVQMARGNQMQAAFLKAVAGRLGARAVSEVFDNDQLNTIWRGLGD